VQMMININMGYKDFFIFLNNGLFSVQGQ
jgi:hypothetical protein